jgi:hypothetical protein
MGSSFLSGCCDLNTSSLGAEVMGTQLNSRIRLVRLRPAYAHLYPGLDPRVWETATEVAARLLAQHSVQSSPGSMLTNRVLPDEHFEFHGGSGRGSGWNGPRSRISDN